MYNFVDTIEASEGFVLPSEALKINGEYIENLISGYRTLSVAGREALSPDVVSYSTGVRDGSNLKSKRYPERIIVVTYQINAASNEAFREAYNKLGLILDVEEAQLIFNDEQDKFYIGTPCIIGEVEPGRNIVTGKFEILCTDPFKYSVIEYEATPNLDESSVLIDYKGTYKAFPTLQTEFYSESEVADDGETTGELTGNGDCGFVSFFTEDEKIIQLGDPDEIDGTPGVYPKSQTLLNQLFHKSTCWGSATQRLLSHNSGDVLPENVQQIGSFKMGTAPNEIEKQTYYLTANTYGTAANAWHGAFMTKTLPADASGVVGAKNFTATTGVRMGIGKASNATKQMGAMQIQICDANGNNIAGVRIFKNTVGTAGTLHYFVNGVKVLESGFVLSYKGEVFGAGTDGGTSTITKIGNKVTFTVGKYKKVFTDDAITDMKAVRITYGIEQYGSNTPLSYNGFQWIKFVKNNCETMKEIPNKFSANDVLRADCRTGEIYLNNLLSPELGALGNDWETFCLTPGLNQIGFAYSDWITSEEAPTIKVKYREVFL